MLNITKLIALLLLGSLLLSCEEEEPFQFNHPPVIVHVGAVEGGVLLSESAVLMCYATDEDADSLTYIWTSYAGTLTGSGDQVIWTPPEHAALYPFEIRVEDGRGGFAEREFDVQVFGLGSQTWNFFTPANSEVTSRYLFSVATGPGGTVWTGDDFGRLGRYSNQTWDVWDASVAELVSLAVDTENRVWINSTGSNLRSFDGTTLHTYATPGMISSCVEISALGVVWVGTTQGLFIVDNGALEPYDTSGTWQTDIRISALCFNSAGAAWATGQYQPTDTPALFHFADHSMSMIPLDYASLPPSGIICDHDDNIWIGYESGLSVYDHTRWTHYPTPDPSFTYLGGLQVDVNNHIWTGANHGLLEFDRIQWNTFTGPNGELLESWVSDIAIDPQGNKWLSLYNIGSNGGGLAVFNKDGIH